MTAAQANIAGVPHGGNNGESKLGCQFDTFVPSCLGWYLEKKTCDVVLSQVAVVWGKKTTLCGLLREKPYQATLD